MDSKNEGRGFWFNLAFLVSAVASLLGVLHQIGFLGDPDPDPIPTSSASPIIIIQQQETNVQRGGESQGTSTSRPYSSQPLLGKVPGSNTTDSEENNSGLGVTRGETVPEERVNFTHGSTGTTLYGELFASHRKRYVLWCGQGQLFVIKVNGSVEVSISTPNQQSLGMVDEDTGYWQKKLPLSGDYTVEVIASRASSYTLQVEVK